MHCVKLLSCLYPKLNYYPFLVISKSIRPLCICENVLSFLIVTGRGSVWLGKGLEGCFYHLLLPFVSLVRLHSYIYTWKKNRNYVRTQVLAFKAERKNRGFAGVCSSACGRAGGAGHRLSMLCVTVQTPPWWMSPSSLLHGCPWSPWVWKLVKIFSLRVKCRPILCRHTGVWALFIPVALAAILSSPVGGCGTEFVNRFLLFVLNMLLLIPLNYSFCMTSNRNYVFPFLHLFHRSCFTPYHQPCLLPECVMYWTCPWVDTFPYLGL